MSKPYDVTTKYLLENHPADWLALLGLPAHNVTIIDADLATVTAEADKLLRVEAEPPFIVHLEPQTTYKADMAQRFLVYNVLTEYRTGLLVHTIVVLMRPEADGPVMRTLLQRRFAGEEEPYLQFRFRVVRLWQEPVEPFLNGGLGTLPLAPLCAVAVEDLPGVIQRMEERIDSLAPQSEAGTLWTAAYVLMGLRYPPLLVEQLLKGVRGMKESTTYQAIIAEGEARGEIKGEARGEIKGEARGEQTALRLMGSRRFGQPDGVTLATLQAISSRERLEELLLRLLEVESWDELLA